MENTKTYSIVINGITESVKAVDSLNDALGMLEQRMKAVQNSTVSVGSSGGGSARASALKQEDQLLKQIQKSEQDLINVQREEYQSLLANKDLIKQAKTEAQQRAAQERIAADTYANSMEGIKQKLADIKKVMQTEDIGSESFKQLTTSANELNAKLLEIEKSYGQFGRNVGNYASAAEGFTNIKVTVGNTVREFNNAREASRQLSMELKSMAVNGQQDTEEFKNLQKAVAQLNSDIKDATVSSKAMDNMLDTLQSLGSIGQITQGFSALMGFDDSEIERSIQKLVALQNAMQGLEKIQQQMNSGEGIGGWIQKGNQAIDRLVDGLIGAKTATEGVKTATEGATIAQTANNEATVLGTTSTKTLTTAKEAQTVAQLANNKAATLGATSTKALTKATVASTTATRAATIATRTLGVVLKGLGIGLIIAAITTAIGLISKFIDKQDELKRKTEETKKAEQDAVVAYKMAETEITHYIERIKTFNGTKQQEKVLVEELNKKYGETFGTYKTLQEWYNTLVKNSKEYCKQIEREIRLNVAKQKLEEALKAQQEAESYEPSWYEKLLEGSDAVGVRVRAIAKQNVEAARKGVEDILKEIESGDSKINRKVKEDGKTTSRSVKDIEYEIAQRRISVMKDGLTKTLAQLNLERKKRIEEVKKSGRLVEQQIKSINDEYNAKILEAKKSYYDKRLKAEKDFWDSILNLQRQAKEKSLEIQKGENEADLEEALLKLPKEEDVQGLTLNLDTGFNNIINQYVTLAKKIEYASNKVQEFKKFMSENGDDEVTKQMLKNWEYELQKLVESFATLRNLYPSLSAIVGKWSKEDIDTLSNNIATKTKAYKSYLEDRLNAYMKYYNKAKELRDKEIDDEYNDNKAKEKERHNSIVPSGYSFDTSDVTQKSMEAFNSYLDKLKEAFDKGEMSAEEFAEAMTSTIVKAWEKIRASMSENGDEMLEEWKGILEKVQAEYEIHQNNIDNIEKEHNLKKKQSDQEYRKENKKANADYWSDLLKQTDEGLSAMNKKMDNATVMNSWGIVNPKKTKENLKEVETALKEEADRLKQYRAQINEQFKGGELESEAFVSITSILDITQNELNEKLKENKEKQENITRDFLESCQKYVQYATQLFQNIMEAVWEAQNEQYERELEQIDKEWDKLNEQLEKKLDEQEEIIERHKDAVNTIEEELSTARGDRRARLIDQLSAEIAAQRAAQAQEKILQKKKEAEEAKAQKKKEELEKKQRKAEWERNVIQAIVNGALAVGYAAINKWPIPAIPMMKAAAVSTAAQLAIVMANKPYEKGGQLDGGVAQGKRHRDGGIPVLGGRASIEGGEFITNRRTTASNVDLLEYINSKHRKLSIDDFIDFYGSGKVKRSISIPTTRFADGGQIPTLNNDIDVNDRLAMAFEDYANRPIYVAVTDIEKGMKKVNYVRTLAGVE